MTAAVAREIQDLRLLMGSPRDPEGFVFAQLGAALLRDGEVEEALDVLREGVERHPHFSPGHLALGWAAQQTGDFDAALESYRRTLELDPENVQGLFGAGRLLDLMGDESGSRLMREAAELDGTVKEAAPGLPQRAARLGDLPFMTLAELAPEAEAEAEVRRDGGDPMSELPFMALADLAPEEEPPAAGSDEGLSSLPFVKLADLAPDEESTSIAVEEPEVVEVPFDEPAPETGDATPVTRTMAELLAQQGHVERAADIYRELLRQSPGNQVLEARLQELEGTGGPGPAQTGEAVADTGEASAAAESDDDAHLPFVAPEPPPSAPSPYDWEDDEAAAAREPAASEPSASVYFGNLLSWNSPGGGEEEQDPDTDPS